MTIILHLIIMSYQVTAFEIAVLGAYINDKYAYVHHSLVSTTEIHNMSESTYKNNNISPSDLTIMVTIQMCRVCTQHKKASHINDAYIQVTNQHKHMYQPIW